MKDNSSKLGPITVGLDVGTTKTVIIVGQRNNEGKIEILGYGKSISRGIKEAEVINMLDVSNSIKEALNKCYASNSALKEIKEVIVGIAGKHISCKQEHGYINRTNNEEPITKEEEEKLKELQYKNYVVPGDKIINVIPKYYMLDNKHIVNELVGCVCRRVDAYYNVITGNTEEIKKICNAVEKAGLTIQEIYLQPLASSLSVLSETHKKAGVIIADIGGGTTDIAVFQNGSLCHTSVINLAGEFITESIYKSLNLFRIEEAEALKIQFGSCISNMVKQNVNVTLSGEKGMSPSKISIYQLSLNINHSVTEIIKQINSNLTNNGINLKNIKGGIVLTGGSSLLNHLKFLIEHETGFITKIGEPIEHLIENSPTELAHPENATCIGLILYGFELYDKLTINNIDIVELYKENENIKIEENELQIKDIQQNNINKEENNIQKRKSIFKYLDSFITTISNEFSSNDEKLK